MSRSKKKVGIYKSKATFGKKWGNRKFRRKSKQKAKKPDEDTMFPEDKSEVINDYDVCDWKWFTDDPKAKRK